MPFIAHTPAVKKTKLIQWDGTASMLAEIQAYVDQLFIDRPWADADQTMRPIGITLTRNADNTLTITAGSLTKTVNVGDWITEIEPGPNGIWSTAIYPDGDKKKSFDVAK